MSTTPLKAARNMFALLEDIEREHALGLRLDLVDALRTPTEPSSLRDIRQSATSVLDLLRRVASADSDLRLAVPNGVLRSLEDAQDAQDRTVSTVERAEVLAKRLRSYGDLLGLAPGTAQSRPRDLAELKIALSKRTRNNVVICAPAGSGKTTLVEHFAWQIRDETPVVRVDVARMVSGTKYRGDLESRFVDLFQVAEESRLILFVDEIHVLATIGSADGGVDILSLLKPHLTRGDFTIIGATTPAEAPRLFSDLAIRRRFSLLRLQALTRAELLGIFHAEVTTNAWLCDLGGDTDAMLDALAAAVPHRTLLDASADFLEYAEACRRHYADGTDTANHIPTTFSAILQRFVAVQHDVGEPDEAEARREVPAQ